MFTLFVPVVRSDPRHVPCFPQIYFIPVTQAVDDITDLRKQNLFSTSKNGVDEECFSVFHTFMLLINF